MHILASWSKHSQRPIKSRSNVKVVCLQCFLCSNVQNEELSQRQGSFNVLPDLCKSPHGHHYLSWQVLTHKHFHIPVFNKLLGDYSNTSVCIILFSIFLTVHSLVFLQERINPKTEESVWPITPRLSTSSFWPVTDAMLW